MTHFPNADFRIQKADYEKRCCFRSLLSTPVETLAAIIGAGHSWGFYGFSRYLFCNAADYLRQQIRLVKFAKSSVGRCPRPREAISSGSLC
jgi:hypothetical protein